MRPSPTHLQSPLVLTGHLAGRRSPGMTARLEKIRALIDVGEYPIDLDALAMRIVDAHSG